ncbi:MAG: hypothetical protein DRI34_01935 [Deltaproteobacteria bacterium]|nr:MAG: hypothetical protein DRI34_01935 [Deltaproteobacteria bacterium]
MVLDEPKDTDEKFEMEGVTFLVEKGLLEQSGGITIDLPSGYPGYGFSIKPVKPLWDDSGSSGCGDCSC